MRGAGVESGTSHCAHSNPAALSTHTLTDNPRDRGPPFHRSTAVQRSQSTPTVHHPGAGATSHPQHNPPLHFLLCARAPQKDDDTAAMSSKPSSPKGKGAEVAAAAPSPDGAKGAAHTGGEPGSVAAKNSSSPSSPAAADQSHDPADGPTITQIPYVCASASFFFFFFFSFRFGRCGLQPCLFRWRLLSWAMCCSAAGGAQVLGWVVGEMLLCSASTRLPTLIMMGCWNSDLCNARCRVTWLYRRLLTTLLPPG